MALRHNAGSSSEEGGSNGERLAHAESLEQEEKGFCVLCWGCGLQLILPSYSPIFKCGYCGAISYTDSASEPDRHHPPRCPKFFVLRDRMMVAVVSLLISAIIGGGIWATFPVHFPRSNASYFLHSCITALLSANVLFNFTMAVSRKAGKVHSRPWGQVDVVPRNSLERYTFCQKCSLPKPPGAHHCRQCRECVLEMDHHCPFIGNCVGASNQRHFVLFLTWVIVSCTYLVGLCITALFRLTPSSFTWKGRKLIPGWGGGYLGSQLLKALLQYEVQISVRMMVLGYLVIVSITCIIGIGFLLYQQVQLILEGQTFIDSLQAPHDGAKSADQGVKDRPTRENLERIFGKSHPLWWLMPRIDPPPGSYAAFIQSKQHTS